MRTSVVIATIALLAVCASLASAGQTYFTTVLLGANEVPAVSTTARGICVALFDDVALTLQTVCGHNVTSGTAAHIHGPANTTQTAPAVKNFNSGAALLNATFTLSATEAQYLSQGLLYVNVHSGTFSAGEIRGQLVNATCSAPSTTTPFVAILEAGQEVPPTNSSNGGVALGTYTFGTRLMSGWIFSNIPTLSSMHIHGPAAPGASAPPVVTLSPAVTPYQIDQVTLTATDGQSLRNGLLYLNLHSAHYPNGEIRGQLYTTCLPSSSGAAAAHLPALLPVVVLAVLLALLQLWL